MNDFLDSFGGLFKHFGLVEKGVDVSFMLKEVKNNDHLWSDGRVKSIWVQRETRSIILRKATPNIRNVSRKKHIHYFNVQRSEQTKNYNYFPEAVNWLTLFASRQKGTLSRVYIVELFPQGQVYKHYDCGLYFALRDRYHLVLKSNGSRMKNGGQQVIFNEGEVWWYNNKVPHESFNDSDEGRIHIIFDLLPKSPTKLFKNILMWFYLNLRINRLFISNLHIKKIHLLLTPFKITNFLQKTRFKIFSHIFTGVRISEEYVSFFAY